MTTTPHSNVQEARRALGRRLREIRQDAGITARALAKAAGWHESKCSRIENGRTPPSSEDIRAYTLLCAAERQTDDLIATARDIRRTYVEWRRLERSGLKHAQESVVPVWDRTRRFRFYSSWLIPGPLQTRAYIRALLTAIRDRRGLVDDLDEAVEVRLGKQQVIHSDRTFSILLEESVLRTRIGTAETMAGQLGHLIAVSTLPAVSLGVIPLAADRSQLWPTEGFFMFDDDLVNVELVSAHLTITQPHEVGMYARTFADLATMAVYGSDARSLITAAIDAVG
ncbi:helix-turn-helix transcriptional regulator [Kitasatospora sp. NPDC002040]|uniref:helix-turn-helix domain-containing protein n=1 Tax=Kitasatospora sp. NPDC002040 TaxID=3154661 RepID=UPI0033257CB6